MLLGNGLEFVFRANYPPDFEEFIDGRLLYRTFQKTLYITMELNAWKCICVY
jgi:hypothetical protein